MTDQAKSTVKAWLHGLAAALITSASTAAMSAMGNTLMGEALNLKQLATTCAMAGLIGAMAYLKQSPLPPTE